VKRLQGGGKQEAGAKPQAEEKAAPAPKAQQQQQEEKKPQPAKVGSNWADNSIAGDAALMTVS
jgi:hypothetical protein